MNIRLKPLLLISTLLITGNVQAFNAQAWECWKRYDTKKTIIIKLTATKNKEGENYSLGAISVAGTVHQAQYHVDGIDRRWNFGRFKDKNGFPYAFIIQPDNIAAYYDFMLKSPVKPSRVFQCNNVTAEFYK